MADSQNPYASPRNEDAKLAEPEAAPPRKEMNFWLAVAWSVLVLVTMIAVQTIVILPFLFARMAGQPPSELERVVAELEYDGTVLAIATCLSTLVCIAAVALIVHLSGWNVRDYLRLNWPAKASHVVVSFLLVIAFLALSDGLTYLLQREIVPDFMVQAFESSLLPLLVFAVVVAAPVGEEVIFRGFLIRNFSSSTGPIVAIVISSVVWAAIHLQYDLYGITTVFLGGLLLGGIYQHTRSLSLCILLHAFWNLIATAEAFIYINYLR